MVRQRAGRLLCNCKCAKQQQQQQQRRIRACFRLCERLTRHALTYECPAFQCSKLQRTASAGAMLGMMGMV